MSELIAALLVVAGGLFVFVAALGVLRLPDVLIRMHPRDQTELRCVDVTAFSVGHEGIVDADRHDASDGNGLLRASNDRGVRPAFEGHRSLGDLRRRNVARGRRRQAGGRQLTEVARRIHGNLCLDNIHRNADDEQRARFVPGLCSGELIGGLAMTEPGAGSDAIGSMATRAVRDGDDYVINGSKTFISNGPIANVLLLYAKTDPAAGSRGVSAFIVETDTPGFTVARKLDKMGWRGSPLGELVFDDMKASLSPPAPCYWPISLTRWPSRSRLTPAAATMSPAVTPSLTPTRLPRTTSSPLTGVRRTTPATASYLNT